MGELAIEYSEVLKRIAVLRQELYRMGGHALDIAHWLQAVPESGGDTVLDHRIDQATVAPKVEQLRAALKERARIERQLQELGLGNLIRTERI